MLLKYSVNKYIINTSKYLKMTSITYNIKIYRRKMKLSFTDLKYLDIV